MSIDPQKVRIDGVYPQRQEGFFMMRVKLPAGVVSAIQARGVADIADRFGRGVVHVTCRGSMELHWITLDNLHTVKQELAKAGLTSRGACGGAVRGISCSSHDSVEFPQFESLARRIHRHFTGNPRFEGLPKKFKVGIEAGTSSGRHLIQDVGLIFAGNSSEGSLYDIWIAGGLGREPQAGFLLEKGVNEKRIIPVIEAVATVYARLAPPPKRVKYLAAQLGTDELARLIRAEPSYNETLPDRGGFSDNMTIPLGGSKRLLHHLFAGQVTSAGLRQLAVFADDNSNGLLQTTSDQNIAFPLSSDVNAGEAAARLAALPDAAASVRGPATFRVCPGNHECKMGLAPTRSVAMELAAAMAETAEGLSWALSGCANSCTQPQLADYGIVTSKLVSGDDGVKQPLFDLYQRKGAGLGERVREKLTVAELAELIPALEK